MGRYKKRKSPIKRLLLFLVLVILYCYCGCRSNVPSTKDDKGKYY